MALRLIELRLPYDAEQKSKEILKDYKTSDFWVERSDNSILYKVILPAEQTERIMDSFQKHFKDCNTFRMILLPIEAIVPPPKECIQDNKIPQSEIKQQLRVSREELYHDIENASKLNINYLLMVLLSAIVASIGILKNDIAIIIGAMMIAPLLGPNVALSFAVTLGDIKLTRESLKVNFAGLILAFCVSTLIGFLFQNYLLENLSNLQTSVGLEDIALALCAGVAGALAFTTGVPAMLIGVMIAVALLPPLVTFGLLVGSGTPSLAYQAVLRLLVNIICINLAGVVTFYLQGIKPLTWWEEGRAKKSRNTAIGLLVILLLTLTIIIFLLRSV